MATIQMMEEDAEIFLRDKYKFVQGETKCLGGGAYADVYAIARGKVLKYVRRDDRAYAEYLEWMLDHQSNIHVPKIFAAHKFRSWGSCGTVVVLERLQPIPYMVNSPRGNLFSKRRDDFISMMGNRMSAPQEPQLNEIWSCINWLTEKRRFCFDLGGPNLLMRRDGTFVVTDPVC